MNAAEFQATERARLFGAVRKLNWKLGRAAGRRATARLKRLREHHRWTWAEVAHALGLSVSMLMMVQRGARQLSRRAALRLLDAEIAAGLAPAGERQVRFPGLIQAAHKLRVHRNHLYLVLAGKRTSHSLTRRYQALKRGGAR